LPAIALPARHEDPLVRLQTATADNGLFPLPTNRGDRWWFITGTHDNATCLKLWPRTSARTGVHQVGELIGSHSLAVAGTGAWALRRTGHCSPSGFAPPRDRGPLQTRLAPHGATVLAAGAAHRCAARGTLCSGSAKLARQLRAVSPQPGTHRCLSRRRNAESGPG